jgi:hypothetical protein
MIESDRGKVSKSVRVPADTADQIERYAEERGISESDALRRFLERGVHLSDEVREVSERLEQVEEQTRPWWRRLLRGQ